MQDFQPLAAVISQQDAQALAWGQLPGGGSVEASDLVLTASTPRSFDLPIPAAARVAQLLVEVELDLAHGDNCIVRCTIGNTAAMANV